MYEKKARREKRVIKQNVLQVYFGREIWNANKVLTNTPDWS